MNSIIEAQITLKEEQEKEIERCKDPYYFFINYWTIKGLKVGDTEIARRDVTRNMFERFKKEQEERKYETRDILSSIEFNSKYPLTPNEAYIPKVVSSGTDSIINRCFINM